MPPITSTSKAIGTSPMPPPPLSSTALSAPALTSPMRSVKSSRIAGRPSSRLAFSASFIALAVSPSGAAFSVLPARTERPATST